MDINLIKQALNRIIRDQAWQFISAVIGIIGISASFLIFAFQREVRALRIETLAITPLVEIQETIASDIEVLYKNKHVTSLSLVDVRVVIIGSKAIREEDYVSPIKFVFPPTVEIIEANILKSVPSDIGLSLTTNQNEVELSSVLLNPRDEISIRFILLNMPVINSQPYVVEARIIELADIDYVTSAKENFLSSRRTVSFSTIIILVTIFSIVGIYLGVRISRPARR